MKRTTSDGSNPPISQVPSIDSVLRPVPIPPSRHEHPDLQPRQQRLPSWTLNPDSRTLPPLPRDGHATPTAKMTVDDTVASTDLQNPADALEFLAHVAERDSGSNQLPPLMGGYGRSPSRSHLAANDGSRTMNQSTPSNVIDYPPLNKGQLSYDMVQALLYR